jgi:NADH-quinone oxidoreductase subunit M
MTHSFILLALILTPLLGVIALQFIPKDNYTLGKNVGVLFSGIPFLFSIYVIFDYFQDGGLTGYSISKKWITFGNLSESPGHTQTLYKVGFDLGLNGFSLLLVFLTALLCMLSAYASIKQVNYAWRLYFSLFLILETAMLGVFSAQDIFLFFLFFEVTLITMFILVGKWGYEERAKAAYRFLVYNALGSLIMFSVFVYIFVNTGTSNIGTLTELIALNGRLAPEGMGFSDETRSVLFLLLLLAFAVKFPIVPFHTWLINVHAQALPAIVMLHAGILIKMGAYGLIIFGLGFFPDQAQNYSFLIAILGLVNLIYGAMLAMIEDEIKKVLAYSTVSHMGIVLLGIAALNEFGIQGAMFQVISHGLIAAIMFYLVGKLYERSETTVLRQLGGVAKDMPILSGFLLAGGMASLGLPGMSGFISEAMAFVGLFEKEPVITVIAVLGIIIAAVYVLRAVLAITFGKGDTMKERKWKDLSFTEALPAIILLSAILFIGILPNVFAETLRPAIELILKGIGG